MDPCCVLHQTILEICRNRGVLFWSLERQREFIRPVTVYLFVCDRAFGGIIWTRGRDGGYNK